MLQPRDHCESWALLLLSITILRHHLTKQKIITLYWGQGWFFCITWGREVAGWSVLVQKSVVVEWGIWKERDLYGQVEESEWWGRTCSAWGGLGGGRWLCDVRQRQRRTAEDTERSESVPHVTDKALDIQKKNQSWKHNKKTATCHITNPQSWNTKQWKSSFSVSFFWSHWCIK